MHYALAFSHPANYWVKTHPLLILKTATGVAGDSVVDKCDVYCNIHHKHCYVVFEQQVGCSTTCSCVVHRVYVLKKNK